MNNKNQKINKDQVNEIINLANEKNVEALWAINGDAYTITIHQNVFFTYEECEEYLENF